MSTTRLTMYGVSYLRRDDPEAIVILQLRRTKEREKSFRLSAFFSEKKLFGRSSLGMEKSESFIGFLSLIRLRKKIFSQRPYQYEEDIGSERRWTGFKVEVGRRRKGKLAFMHDAREDRHGRAVELAFSIMSPCMAPSLYVLSRSRIFYACLFTFLVCRCY